MRTRDMGYDDYLIQDGEEKALIEDCRKVENKQLLIKAAYEANMWLADDIIYSLFKGLSYDKICFIRDIPCKKVDFYGYRRKTLAIYRDMTRTGD